MRKPRRKGRRRARPRWTGRPAPLRPGGPTGPWAASWGWTRRRRRTAAWRGRTGSRRQSRVGRRGAERGRGALGVSADAGGGRGGERGDKGMEGGKGGLTVVYVFPLTQELDHGLVGVLGAEKTGTQHGVRCWARRGGAELDPRANGVVRRLRAVESRCGTLYGEFESTRASQREHVQVTEVFRHDERPPPILPKFQPRLALVHSTTPITQRSISGPAHTGTPTHRTSAVAHRLGPSSWNNTFSALNTCRPSAHHASPRQPPALLALPPA